MTESRNTSSSRSKNKTGKKHEMQREVAEAIANYLIAEGLENSGIRALAKAAGVSDRMLIYYFGSKEQAIAAALEFIAAALAERLNAIISEDQLSAAELTEQLVAAGSSAAFQPVIRLWFELVGYAVRGEAPYQDSVRVMAANWQMWIEAKLASSARPQAETVFAQVEGKLMIDLLRG